MGYWPGYPTTFIHFAYQSESRLWLHSIWLCTKFLSTYAGPSTKSCSSSMPVCLSNFTIIKSLRTCEWTSSIRTTPKTLYTILFETFNFHSQSSIAYNSVFNCKFKRSFDLKPNQMLSLGSRNYKPLNLRKRMYCTAQSHLNHHGFLNDLRLTSACTILAKNLPFRKYLCYLSIIPWKQS